jgi:hypothetical protein
MDKELAHEFVRQHGDPTEHARLAYLLNGRPPLAEAVETLLTNQRPDGCWPPFWAPDYGSLDATCYRLAQAHQLGLGLTEEPIRRAIAGLVARQREDGRWEEDEAVKELAPPWAMPGDISATLYLTANCAFWLALFGSAPSAVERAALFLHAYLDENGSLPTFLHAHWLAAATWRRLGMAEAVGRSLGYLESRVSELPASSLAWLISALCLAGVPASEPTVAAAAARLANLQAEDGRWVSEDGMDRDVSTTLDALWALALCG